MSAILFDATGNNLILGFMPESLGLLIFGVALILFAVGLRRIFDRNDDRQAVKEFERAAGKINR
jgi:hypothetical protein